MSNVIDNRIVRMEFDNAKFEQGVQQTTKSLANLDKTIEAASESQAGSKLASIFTGLANKLPLDSISNAAGNVAHTIGNIFSETAHQVSNLSKIGLGAITAMGAGVTALAATGGMKRALNIEQAKFQLDGLGVAWDKIYDDLDYAVSGTAYGLDSAAKAASQLVASNVEVGDSMKTALRGISGVAAMTNREYDEVAHIFTTVAGTGRMMGMQLTQLGTYGINAAASIAKYFQEVRGEAEVTEETIREMASEGKIDFATFAEAMDWNYGEHAKDANKTFTGSMANTKAALSRIGEQFATPYMENMKDVFNALIPFLNMIKNSMTPIFDEFSSVMQKGKTAVVNFLEPFTGLLDIETDTGVVDVVDRTRRSIIALQRTFKTLIEIGHTIGDAFGNSFKPMAEALSEIWGFDDVPKGYLFLEQMQRSISDFNENVIQKMDFGRFFDAMLGPVHIEGMELKQIFDTIVSSFSDVDPASAFNGFVDVFEVICLVVEDALTIWNRFIQNGIEMAAPVIKDVAGFLHDFALAFDEVFRGDAEYAPILDDILGFMDGIKDGFLNFYGYIKDFIPSVDNLKTVFQALGDVLGTLGGFVSGNLETIGTFFAGLVSVAPDADAAADGFDRLAQGIKFVLDNLAAFGESSGILPMIREIAENLSHLTFGDLASTLAGGLIVQGLITIRKMLTALKGDVSNFNASNILGKLGIVPALDELKGALTSFSTSSKAEALKQMSISLLIFAGSLLLLSAVPFDKLASGSAALLIFGAALTKMFKSIATVSFNGAATAREITRIIGTLLAISVSLLLLSASMKILSTMGSGTVAAVIGMLVIVGSMAALIAVIGETTREGSLAKGGALMVGLGFALLQMSLAMKILSTIQGEGLKSALASITVMGLIVALIIAVTETMERAGSIVASALMFATIGAAFVALAASMKILSTIDSNAMLTSIAGLSAITVAIIALMAVFGRINPKKIMASSLVFVTIGAAFVSLAMSLSILSQLSSNSLINGVAALGSSLLIMVGAVAALGAIGAKAIAGAGVMAIMSASMLMLAPAVAVLAALPITGVGVAVAALVGIIAAITVASKLVNPVSLLALSGALLSLAASVIAFGASIGLAAAGIGVFAIGVAALIEAIATFGNAIANMGKAFGDFIVGVINALASHSGELAEAGKNLLIAFVNSVGSSITAVVELGLTIVMAFLDGIASSMGRITSSALHILEAFILGIAEGMGGVMDAGMQSIVMFIKGMADSFRTNRHMLENAITDLMNTVGMAFLEGLANIVQVIPFFGEDMAKGLRDQASVMEAAADEASAAVQKEFDEKNKNILNGTSRTMDEAGNIIENSSGDLSNSAENASSGVTQSFLGSLGIGDGVSQEMNLTSDNIEQWAPKLSAMSGVSADDIVSRFKEHVSGMSDAAATESQETADAIGAVDYATPAEQNGAEVAQSTASGIDSNAWRIENSADTAVDNAVYSANDEASYAGSAGGTFTSYFAGGIDPYGANWNAQNLAGNAKGNLYVDTSAEGQYFSQGFINGMDSFLDAVGRAAHSLGTWAVQNLQLGIEMGSPSKLTAEAGRFFGIGFVNGITETVGMVGEAAYDLGDNAVIELGNALHMMDGVDWDSAPTITPVLDTSLVESGLDRMNGFFADSQTRQAGWASGNYALVMAPYGDNQNGATSNNITVQLNYDAGADANELVLGIARALRTTAIMEG